MTPVPKLLTLAAGLSCLCLAVTAPNAAAETVAARGDTWTWFGINADPDTAYNAGAPGDAHTVVCRIRHRRDVEAGQLVNGLCLVGNDDMARPYSGFEILQRASGLTWTAGTAAIAAGTALNVNADRGPALYVCRLTHDGKTRIGMVRDDLCSAAVTPEQVTSDTFDVLTAVP